MNEKGQSDKGRDGKRYKKKKPEMPVSSGRVWGDYGVASGKRGIKDGGEEEEGEIMLDRGEGIKIVFLSCALWKMDI